MQLIEVFGLVGKEPEFRVTASGTKVANFSVAVKTKKGAGKDFETTWYNVCVFNGTFDKLLSHIKKGSQVIVKGDLLAPSDYHTKDGRRVNQGIIADTIRFNPFPSVKRKEDEESSDQLEKEESNNDDEFLPF